MFNSKMIKAILEGRKTMTRRVLRNRLQSICDFMDCAEARDAQIIYGDNGWHSGEGWYVYCGEYPEEGTDFLGKCPYGQVGDKLWVRETFSPMCKNADPYCWCESEEEKKENHYVEYRADTGNKYPGEWDASIHEDEIPENVHWKPSIHMPRWASRITLEITNIRVERLQEITLEDAIAEGVPCAELGIKYGPLPQAQFADLWDALNGKRSYPWESNPWVWVIEFKQI